MGRVEMAGTLNRLQLYLRTCQDPARDTDILVPGNQASLECERFRSQPVKWQFIQGVGTQVGLNPSVFYFTKRNRIHNYNWSDVEFQALFYVLFPTGSLLLLGSRLFFTPELAFPKQFFCFI